MAKFKGTGAGETYVGTSGKDKIDGKGGDDTLFGLDGKDNIKGGDGNDTIKGGDGADKLDGENGNDILDGGAGNDEAVYVAAENVGASDDYRGGQGIDTLALNFTTAEWNDPAVRANVADYLQFIAAHTDPATGQADSAVFQFTAFDLSAREFEALRVVVDGVEIDPTVTDYPVNAVGDAVALTEDALATPFPSVLANDDVQDGVASVT
jgi:Ca2+-binding RTX toxin-like protein